MSYMVLQFAKKLIKNNKRNKIVGKKRSQLYEYAENMLSLCIKEKT